MKLAIGISTMNEGILNLAARIKAIQKDHKIIVCHQVTDGNSYDYSDFFESNTVVIVKNEKGLSKSRNALLTQAGIERADYLIISDDDVEYSIQGIRELMSHINSTKNVKEHYQFKSICENGLDRKKYYNYQKDLKLLDIFKVSSIEMCLNVPLLKSENILFDEGFGLGAKYPVGEEAILMADIVNKRQRIVFLPIAITMHPLESTGNQLFSKPLMIESRGAMFKRCFGFSKGSFFAMLFWLKKFLLRRKNNSDISSYQAFALILKGLRESD
ncbi:MAG: hypothetical protein K0S95_1056 [Pantoea eucrina]|jgi:hypothetical protein|nr:hypothetical protein [Pantoea eucrina]